MSAALSANTLLESPSPNTPPARSRGLASFSKYREIIIAVALFLLFDLGVLLLNFYTSFQIAEDALGVNLSGRQRMLSQRTAKALLSVDAATLKGTPVDQELNELKSVVQLFDVSLKGFQGGAMVPGGDGKPVFLRAAEGAKALDILKKAQAIWTPYQDRLAPVLAGSATAPELQAAVNYTKANNLKLLGLMNELTTSLEAVASQRANTLRRVQTVGIVLALLNFTFILCKLLRRLNTSDAAIEAALLADIRERERAQQKIMQINASLEERVKQRTAQLEHANKELEAFSYSVSHDLRTPLSSIDGFSGLLEKALVAPASPKTSERSLHCIKRIRVGVAHMGELIDALLSLAQVSRTRLRWEPVNLSALVQVVLDGYQERHPERAVQIDIEPSLMAYGDPRLLKQVFDNLLGNAWKFSTGQPRTQIAFGHEPGDGGERVYFIRDNGAGFDMAYAEKLFGAFQRLHTTSEFAGSGIGLATVHRIVVRHGGRIWAQSAPQQGATFYFTLKELPVLPEAPERLQAE